MRVATLKYLLNHRKHIYELVDKLKKQLNRIFIDGKLAIKVIMDCITISAYKFRANLGFKQNIILTIGQSVLTKTMRSFEGENMQTQYNVLDYRIELHFRD